MSLEIRVGLGHDTHRIAPGGPMKLGGVVVECDIHLVGHSDADVLLHAITDSILGAANLGDIGEMFPDTEPANKGKDSGEMLKDARARVNQAGWSIVNLDCVVLTECPRMQPIREDIKRRVSQILQITPDRVSVKGKTGERTGEIGTGQIAQSICTCLLQRD